MGALANAGLVIVWRRVEDLDRSLTDVLGLGLNGNRFGRDVVGLTDAFHATTLSGASCTSQLEMRLSRNGNAVRQRPGLCKRERAIEEVPVNTRARPDRPAGHGRDPLLRPPHPGRRRGNGGEGHRTLPRHRTHGLLTADPSRRSGRAPGGLLAKTRMGSPGGTAGMLAIDPLLAGMWEIL